MTDPRGRWFRVYARQIRRHPKFADMTLAQLGAWLELRVGVELKDGYLLDDRAEAERLLRRRGASRPASALDELIARRLFDEQGDGGIVAHDRADHDRPRFPSEEPEAIRERVQRYRETRRNDSLQGGGNDDVTIARAREKQRQPTETETAGSKQPRNGSADLPSETDAATLACRYLPDGGRWLSDKEYTSAWDDMEHRFGPWVVEELAPAYASLIDKGKVRAWDLKRMVELRCAERTRAEEHARQEKEQAILEKENAQLRAKQERMTAEQRERSDLMRRATGIWLRDMGGEIRLPTDLDELRTFVEEHEAAGE